MTPVTTACPFQKIAEGKASYELSRRVKVMIKKRKEKKMMFSH